MYAWGGGGKGPLAIPPDDDADDEEREITDEERDLGPEWMRPMYVNSLRGEGIVQMATGYSHVGAVSDGGDAYTWGSGRHGQLGTASSTSGYNDEVLPTLVDPLQDLYIRAISVGQAHSVAITDDGQVLAWGHGAKGRLGLGTETRKVGAARRRPRLRVSLLTCACARDRACRRRSTACSRCRRCCRTSWRSRSSLSRWPADPSECCRSHRQRLLCARD